MIIVFDKIPTFRRLFWVRSLIMSHQNSWFHTLPSICLSWVQTCDIIIRTPFAAYRTHKHLTGSEKGEGVLRSPFPSSLKMRITSEWNFMSLIPLRGSTVLLIKQSSHFKSSASYSDVDVYLHWWKSASKGRREGENRRFSSFSFPWSLALCHQSLECHSRFALASARKTKRLRRRQKRCC